MYQLVKIGRKHFVESTWLHTTEPKRTFVRWEVLETNGYIPEKIEEWMKPDSRGSFENSCSWSLYCGNGRYVTLVTPKFGTSENVDVPKPKGIRKTTETRWNPSAGGWQKYTISKGWQAA